jgi:signal transduction histidine kinase/Flp pilus assembly protein TadD
MEVFRKLFLLLIVIISCNSIKLFSQDVNIDSLISLSENTTDQSEKVRLLNQIGNQIRYNDFEEAYLYLLKSEELAIKLKDWEQLTESYNVQGIIWHKRKEIDSAYLYLNRGLSIAKEYDDYNGMLKSLNSLGLYTYFKKDYKKALVLYKDALLIVDKVSNLELVIMLYNNIAMLHKSIGEHDLAIEYYHKAIIICEEINNTKGSGIVCSNLGLLYEKQEKYQLALEYLFKSLEIRQSRNNLKGEAIVLNNLGVIYEGMGQNEKALEYYNLSLKIKKQLNHESGIAKIYNNIGIIYKNLNMLDSAHFYYNKSLKINRKLNNRTGISHNYTNIGILYKLEQNFESAIQYFNDAADIAEEDNDIQELIRIYKGLFGSFNSIGNYKNAFEYSHKYQVVYDSIYNLNSKKYIEEVEGKYQNLKKEKENQALLSENLIKDEQLRRQVIIGLLIILLAILILVVLFVVIKSKSKLERVNKLLSNKNVKIKDQRKKLIIANQKLIKLGLFKENLTNMIAHDLKNPLNSIINITSLENMKNKEEFIQQAGRQMLNLVTNMLDVYKSEQADLEIKKRTEDLLKTITQALEEVHFLVKHKSLEVKLCDSNFIVQIDKEIIKRVFVNLFTNAIKFSPQKGVITIKCNVEKNELRIAIVNQGVGISQKNQEMIFELYKQTQILNSGSTRSTGLGLTFCKMAVEAHGGKIGVISEAESGVEFWFTLPDYQINKTPIKNRKNGVDWKHNLSLFDKEYLLPFVEELKKYEIYEISVINSIMKNIDKKNENINNWKNDVEKALYEGKSELFLSLISF